MCYSVTMFLTSGVKFINSVLQFVIISHMQNCIAMLQFLTSLSDYMELCLK